jgi:hypothetical protein
MQKSEIKPGREYALLEKRVPGAPIEHVKVLSANRRKGALSSNGCQIRHSSPNPGPSTFELDVRCSAASSN